MIKKLYFNTLQYDAKANITKKEFTQPNISTSLYKVP